MEQLLIENRLLKLSTDNKRLEKQIRIAKNIEFADIFNARK